MVDRIAHLEMILLTALEELRKLKPKEEKPKSRKKEIQLRARQNFLRNQKFSQ